MKLYKVHKVNPMSGCLPIMIQMPVFISLFYVIRAAVELRFGTFLWIDDLSEPEGLFKDVLPAVLGGLNVLPLAMAGTMFFQQKLSPAPADPAQAKIMKFFPVMLLFMLYKMPSGLMLYWTTSNLLMIGQQMLKLRQTDDDETPTIKNAVEHIPPTKAKKSGKNKKK
jgi:YidC/Oxa1 family membrane protein insertase